MINDNEEWRDIEGFEGFYQVSNQGRVRSLDRVDCRKQKRIGMVLRPGQDKKRGYLNVALCKDGITHQKGVHRLVASAFLGECPPEHEVGHKDHDGSNNHVDNLEYVTHLENMAHAVKHGRMGNLSIWQVRAIRLVLSRTPKASVKLLADAVGVSVQTIRQIAKVERYIHIQNHDGSPPYPLDIARTTLTVEDITSLRARGMTLPQIGRYYGVEYSTPYQILRRAKLKGHIFLE